MMAGGTHTTLNFTSGSYILKPYLVLTQPDTRIMSYIFSGFIISFTMDNRSHSFEKKKQAWSSQAIVYKILFQFPKLSMITTAS